MTTTSMCDLPLELQEHVVDSLRGNRRALVRCALVCKSWHPRAQHNLFHTIRVDWYDRDRTTSLLYALRGADELVYNLTISSEAGLTPAWLVWLVEALENLEVLSIRAPNETSGVLALIISTAGDVESGVGERFLSAIANNAKLRILRCTVSYRTLYAWQPRTAPQGWYAVLDRGLRNLHALEGGLFPAPRMHRLWAALTAAKAHAGAVALTHFGTSVARNGFAPLARFLGASDAPIHTLRLDFRAAAAWREQNTVEAFHASGLSLALCPRLRTLAVHLSAPTRASTTTAFLCTAPPDSLLAHLRIALENLRADIRAHPGVSAALAALDARMAALPRLARVDWRLACPGMRRAPPGGADGLEALSGVLGSCLPALARRGEVAVAWTALRRG